MMTFNQYQEFVAELSMYPKDIRVVTGPSLPWVYPVLGLQGEAGEVAEKAKKYIRDGGDYEEFRKATAKELGDVAFYLAATAKELGFSLEEVIIMNVEKLTSRLKRGVLSGNGDNR